MWFGQTASCEYVYKEATHTHAVAFTPARVMFIVSAMGKQDPGFFCFQLSANCLLQMDEDILNFLVSQI